ncbi:MAG: AAA family ATPase [FCB group bacterium]|jgi:ABC-type Mn2+/Zn2+ transport system ATPase subunit|nr:AAA family ATPase [FCB group bacterium]
MPDTPPRITEIAATRFRGATSDTRIALDPSKPFVLIFGENGTGKSTLVDAIEFVSNLTPGSISDISGATEKQHVQSIGAKLSDLSVELTIGTTSWKAAYSGRQIQRTPADLCTPIHVLRRSKILSFVNAPPAKRFEQLKRFIDVAAVEKCESELAKALSDVKSAFKSSSEAYEGAHTRLATAFAEEHTPEEAGMDPEQWALARAKVDLSEMETRKTLLKKALDTHSQAEIALARKNAEQEKLNQARVSCKEIEARIGAYPDLDAKSAVVLIDLLGKTKNYVALKGDLDACPICAKPNDAQHLESAIDEKLSELSPLVELAKEFDTARASVRAAETVVGSLYRDLISRAQTLAKTLHSLPDCPGVGPEEYPNLFAYEDTLTKANIAETNRFLTAIAPVLSDIQTEHDLLEKKIAPAKGIKRDYRGLVEARSEAARLNRVREVLEIMFEIVVRERRNFVQTILDAIADRCDSLYARIHPGEKLGNVRFALDQVKRASLELTGEFEGHADVPPQAYFSESHLDTLGFCFFLALTHHLTGGKAIIVLDDVFASVDQQHIDRSLDVLIGESERYHQVILLTHQHHWLKTLPREKVDLITLKPWSLDQGVQM